MKTDKLVPLSIGELSALSNRCRLYPTDSKLPFTIGTAKYERFRDALFMERAPCEILDVQMQLYSWPKRLALTWKTHYDITIVDALHGANALYKDENIGSDHKEADTLRAEMTKLENVIKEYRGVIRRQSDEIASLQIKTDAILIDTFDVPPEIPRSFENKLCQSEFFTRDESTTSDLTMQKIAELERIVPTDESCTQCETFTSETGIQVVPEFVEFQTQTAWCFQDAETQTKFNLVACGTQSDPIEIVCRSNSPVINCHFEDDSEEIRGIDTSILRKNSEEFMSELIIEEFFEEECTGREEILKVIFVEFSLIFQKFEEEIRAISASDELFSRGEIVYSILTCKIEHLQTKEKHERCATVGIETESFRLLEMRVEQNREDVRRLENERLGIIQKRMRGLADEESKKRNLIMREMMLDFEIETCLSKELETRSSNEQTRDAQIRWFEACFILFGEFLMIREALKNDENNARKEFKLPRRARSKSPKRTIKISEFAKPSGCENLIPYFQIGALANMGKIIGI